ncbi:MAG: RNase III inhibitor [Firmicutes bacterium]|nr:RNase III inhibitor [Bacillota bacterium]
MRYTFHEVIIEAVRGDIANQPDLEAIVNAANARLAPGGGVAGAIHRAAGPELYEACRPLAPIETGQAVTTPGFRLPNKYVIHALGPVYAFEDEPAGKLARTYRSVFEEAERLGVESVGMPAISTGIFGYPKEEAAAVLAEALVDILPRCRSVKRVRLVLYSEEDLAIHREALARHFDELASDAAE